MVLEYRRMNNSLHMSGTSVHLIASVSDLFPSPPIGTGDTADSCDLGVNADCGQKLDVSGFLSLLQTEAFETLIGVKSTEPHYLTT